MSITGREDGNCDLKVSFALSPPSQRTPGPRPLKQEPHSSCRCCLPLVFMVCVCTRMYICGHTSHCSAHCAVRDRVVSTFAAPCVPFRSHVSFPLYLQERTPVYLSSFLCFSQSGVLSLSSQWAHPSGRLGDLSVPTDGFEKACGLSHARPRGCGEHC